MDFTSEISVDRFNLRLIPTSKFKTSTVAAYIRRPLRRSEVTINALLCAVIKRACPLYPDPKELSRYLLDLYGADVTAGVSKKGDFQIIYVIFEYVNEKYIQGASSDVTSDMIALARNIIFEQQLFDSNIVAQEKANLKNAILALINDKRAYAQSRCTEIMCDGDPHGINELGYIEDIDAITPQSLYAHYQQIISESEINVLGCGDCSEGKIKGIFPPAIKGGRVSVGGSAAFCREADYQPQSVTETDEVAQGKLCMGFRTGTRACDADFPALCVFNSVYGGSLSSKLFLNVREKLSLCYYAFSRIDRFKGVMYVNSGIDFGNYNVARDEIIKQLDEVKSGNVTVEELSNAILDVTDGLRQVLDSQHMTADFFLNTYLSGGDDIETLISKVNSVTLEDVVRVSQSVTLDTSYFLTSKQ